MSDYASRPFTGDADMAGIVAMVRAGLSVRWPALPHLHPGDVTWQLNGRAATPAIRLWEDAAGLAGYADFQAPVHLVIELRHDIPPGGPLFAEMLAWGEERARQVPAGAEIPIAYRALGPSAYSTQALDSDSERVGALGRAGFRKLDIFGYRMRRSLALLDDAPRPLEGVTLRHAGEADVAGRVDLHRDAWSVWGPSSFSERAYRLLRAAPEYREDLDIVAVLEGRLVAYTVCWADSQSGVGIFEPVGTRPALAGLGLGRQVIFEGLRRLRDMGMHTALIGTSSVNAPAERLYSACGFEHVDREYFYGRELR